MTGERLQKYLASLGFGSRREIERWIRDKKIQVNGKVAELGLRVLETDRIVVKGKPVRGVQKEKSHEVLVLNKPLGHLCSNKPEKSYSTVFELLPRIKGQRWISVGRLDLNTSGLLLFTTDGELVNKLTHPSSEIEREYLVRVLGKLTGEQLELLGQGVLVDGKAAKFKSIQLHRATGANNWYRVILAEGRYREVRKIFETQGLKVNRLIRTRYGPIEMNQKLKSGEHYLLNSSEKEILYGSVKSKG